MHSELKRKQETDIADLYAVKFGSVWRVFKNQHISFWMLTLYYFFEYVRPHTIYPQLDVLPWAQITLVVTLAAVLFDRSVTWVAGPINKLLVLFYLVVILSGVFAFMPSSAWDDRNRMLTWLLVYFLTINIVNSERRLIVFVVLYLLFNFKMSQHGALTWASRGFSFSSWGLTGAPGPFRNSGEYAIQMLIFGSLAIAFVFALKDHWGTIKRWLLYAAAATGYMAVMGSSSRGAQLALGVVAIWMMLAQKWGVKALMLLLIGFAALYFLLPDEQIQRFHQIGNDTDSLQRLAYWKYALSEVIPRHPILGVGYHNWLAYVTFKAPEGLGPYAIVQEPHNIYIQAAAELGVTGLIAFLLLAICAFIVNARTRAAAKKRDNRLLFNLTYGLDAGLIGYLVAGLFVSVLYYPFFWIQITMVAMTNAVAVRKVANQRAMTGPGPGHTGAAAGKRH